MLELDFTDPTAVAQVTDDFLIKLQESSMELDVRAQQVVALEIKRRIMAAEASPTYDVWQLTSPLGQWILDNRKKANNHEDVASRLFLEQVLIDLEHLEEINGGPIVYDEDVAELATIPIIDLPFDIDEARNFYELELTYYI